MNWTLHHQIMYYELFPWDRRMQYVTNFNQTIDILAELDGLLHFCKTNNVDRQIISDINVQTLKYVRKMKKQKVFRNNLLAIPNKGVGICIMKADTYKSKLTGHSKPATI